VTAKEKTTMPDGIQTELPTGEHTDPQPGARAESAALRQTSSDIVYTKIRMMILDNELRAGAHVLEQELVARFGVSRTPVREALVRLQNDGLVEIIPRHGMRVLQVSVDDMQQIYEALISLEATAAELAAKRQPDEAALQPFERACVAMTQGLASGDLDAWAAADEAFHLHLLKLSGNARIEQIVKNFWSQIHHARSVTLRLVPAPHQSVHEHRKIVEAIGRGDARLAHRLVRQHRARGAQRQIDALKRIQM
jgi:DNA-binding GntR family transcriptional regulator